MQEQKLKLIDAVFVLVLPYLINFIVWILLLKLYPAKTSRDIASRLLATFLCSFIFGTMAYVYIHASHNGIITSAETVAAHFGLPSVYGSGLVLSWVYAITGLPGWWIVAGITSWLQKRSRLFVHNMLDKTADKITKEK